MTEPMRRRLDSFSIARRVFLVDPLPPGTLAIHYDTGYRSDGIAYAVGEEGRTIVQVPRNGLIPMFEIAVHPSIPIRRVARNARNGFALIEGTQDQALNDIRAMEAECARMVLEAAVSVVTPQEIEYNITRNLRVPRLTSEVVAESFAMIERNDLRLANLFMNAREYADIRQSMRGSLDIETHREILYSTGLVGTLWGASIFVSNVFPARRIYLTAEPEFVGRMPLRDITVLPAEDLMNMTVGWRMFETVGIYCINPLSVACITISE